MQMLLIARLIFLSLFPLMAAEQDQNPGIFSRVWVVFSMAVSRIAPDPMDAYQRLSNAVLENKREDVLEIIKNEHDSLRSTQEGANLAIIACARFGNANLFNQYCEPQMVSSYGCCCLYSLSRPESEAVADALIEVLETDGSGSIDSFQFLPFKSETLSTIIKKVGKEIITEKNAANNSIATGLSPDLLRKFNKFDSFNQLIHKINESCLDEEAKRIVSMIRANSNQIILSRHHPHEDGGECVIQGPRQRAWG